MGGKLLSISGPALITPKINSFDMSCPEILDSYLTRMLGRS
jgi:hypothetical protein